MFTKATKTKSKLRLAITGPSGSGKTYSALLLAKGLGGKIAVVDTENGSASLYSNIVDFDVMELRDPFSPEHYISTIKEAEKAGYNTLVIDSITPEWSGTGGILQLNQQIADAKFRGNTWSAWSETDPRHRAFIDAQLQCNLDIIVTMRSKTETAQEKDERTGKTKVVHLGMKSEQRDSIIYEYTVVLDLVHEKHYANAIKDRTGLFVGSDPAIISEETGRKIRAWLQDGKEPEKDIKRLAKEFAEALEIAPTSELFEKCVKDNLMLTSRMASEIPDRHERLKQYLSIRRNEFELISKLVADNERKRMEGVPEAAE